MGLMLAKVMPKSRTFANETRKKMGRPRTVAKDDGLGINVGVRLSAEVIAIVDEYAREMGVKRSDAIRDMVNHAIAAWRKKRPGKK